MKSKNFKKYLFQGTFVSLIIFFSYGWGEAIENEMLRGNRELLKRIIYYQLDTLLMWLPAIIITVIPTNGVLCYSMDNLLKSFFKKDLKDKNIQIYLKNMGLFLLKYTLVVIFFLLVFWGGIYIDKFLRKTYNLSYSYCFYIMLGFSILFNYLISWVIYPYKRKKL